MGVEKLVDEKVIERISGGNGRPSSLEFADEPADTIGFDFDGQRSLSAQFIVDQERFDLVPERRKIEVFDDADDRLGLVYVDPVEILIALPIGSSHPIFRTAVSLRRIEFLASEGRSKEKSLPRTISIPIVWI